MPLQVRNTRTGLGVFATKHIAKGAPIITMTGVPMRARALERAIEKGDIRSDDPYQISENGFIVLDRLPYLFNHSCEPNAGFLRGRHMVALCDIRKGEQIRYDYATVVCTHCDWQMVCRCGAPTCRKTIGNVSTIPKALLKKYLSGGNIPPFIVSEL